MKTNAFGLDYPMGAENDPKAPWNEQRTEYDCHGCGAHWDVDDLPEAMVPLGEALPKCPECVGEEE